MYRWRRMTAEQRRAILQSRQSHQLPWHSPPHYTSEAGVYLLTAACFEHRPIIGRSAERMAAFERGLLDLSARLGERLYAWTVLPNHYHLLTKATDVKKFLRALGRLHRRTSFHWNGEDGRRGRKVWFNTAETGMKSDRHFYASLVYVLHNAVKHGYVTRWQDWPYSNALPFLQQVGRDEAARMWREFPIAEFGTGWDPPEL